MWKRLAKHYWVWRLYHLIVADAVAIQRPTKHKLVHEFLGDTLGIAADIGCGPGVFVRHMSARAKYLIEIDVDRDSLERTCGPAPGFAERWFCHSIPPDSPFY